MKTNSIYKISGVLAVLTATMAFNASAQDAAPANPVVPPVSSPQTTATPDTTTPPDLAVQPAAPAVAGATADTSIVAPKDFVQQAFLANEFGIAAGQLALKQAQNGDTKEAAQQVVTDGLKVRADMITAIQGATSDMHFDQSWNDDYKQKLADLQAKTGTDFDAQYLATQGEITNSSEQLYSGFASTGSDAAVKTFAANTLPTLQAEGDKLEAASQGGQ